MKIYIILPILLTASLAFAQVTPEEIKKNIELAQQTIAEDKDFQSIGDAQPVQSSMQVTPSPVDSDGIDLSKVTPEELRIYEEMKKGNIPVKENKGIKRVNPNYRIKRGDSRIVSEFAGVDDIHEIKTCFGNPLIISFGQSIKDKILFVKNGNPAKFSHEVEVSNHRSVTISLNTPADGSVQGHFWIYRDSDNRRYNFRLIGEPCPSEGIYTYPVDVIIEESATYNSPSQRVLLPTDFLIETTKNYQRNNGYALINVNGLLTTASARFTTLGVSISLKDFNGKKMREPRFIVLNWSKTHQYEVTQEYLPLSSQAETDLNKIPTLRFNLRLGLTKKQIVEREYIYLIVMYDDEEKYQIAKVPLKDLLNQLKETGWEI